MAAITEDYVSFETAKLLKEKGFNERLLTFYITDEAKKEGCFQIMAFTDDKIDNNHSDHCYLAPTLQMAMKWLRIIHNTNIDIVSVWNQKRFEYQVFVVTPENAKHCYIDDKLYLGYEQACEAAIKYSLEHLI